MLAWSTRVDERATAVSRKVYPVRARTKKNRWRAEKLEAARETWALLGSFACAQDDPLSTGQTHLLWNRSSGQNDAPLRCPLCFGWSILFSFIDGDGAGGGGGSRRGGGD